MIIVLMMFPIEALVTGPMFLPGVLILRIRVRENASIQSSKLEGHLGRTARSKYTQIKSNFFSSNGRVGTLFCPRGTAIQYVGKKACPPYETLFILKSFYLRSFAEKLFRFILAPPIVFSRLTHKLSGYESTQSFLILRYRKVCAHQCLIDGQCHEPCLRQILDYRKHVR